MDLEPTQAIPLSGGEEDDDETDEEPLGTDKQPMAHLKVLVQRGYPETLFPIYEGLNMIGRAPSCNIHIDLKALSKQHALVEVQGTEHFIVDQGSKNKTRRNKAFLKPNVRYELRGGEQLIFADIECVYLMNNTPLKVEIKKEEVVKESFVYEEDDSDDPSSDILQPTQAYGGDEGKSAKRVRMCELATQMYAADSDEDSPAPSRVLTKKYMVSNTPAATSKQQKSDTTLEDSVIPESDVEPSPISAGNASRVSVAMTETVLYASDDGEDGEDSPRQRGNQGNGAAAGKLISLAATQAYVPDSEEADDDSVYLPAPLARVPPEQPTQAYIMDTEDADTAAQLKQSKSPKKSPTKGGSQKTKAPSPTQATQAYDMDTEDAEKAVQLKQTKSKTKSPPKQGKTPSPTQATQAYDMDVEEDDKRKKSPDSRASDDDDIPTQTYSASGRRIKRKTTLYEEFYLAPPKPKQRKSTIKSAQKVKPTAKSKSKASPKKARKTTQDSATLQPMGSNDFSTLQNDTLPTSIFDTLTSSEMDIMPIEVEISPSVINRLQSETSFETHSHQFQVVGKDDQKAGTSRAGKESFGSEPSRDESESSETEEQELTPQEEDEVLQYCHRLIDEGSNCTRWNLRVFVRTLVTERLGRKFIHQKDTFPSAKWFDEFFEKHPDIKEAIPRSQRIRNAQDARADAVQYMLETGIRNVSKVARMFGITRKFLSNYVKEHNLEDQMPPPCEERSVYYRQLTYEEEEEIVAHCRKQESLGQAVHRTELREYMKETIFSRKLNTRFNRDGPSDKWCGEFFRKHNLREGPSIYRNAGCDKEYVRERGDYDQKDLEAATEAVVRKKMKPTQAALHFGVPRRTLCSRVKKMEKGLPVHDPEADEYKKLLLDGDELDIVEYCMCQAAIQGGLIQRGDLRLNVMEMIQKRKRIKKRTNMFKGPTCNWVRKFIARHPRMEDIVKLTFKKDPPKSVQGILQDFFQRFESLVKRMGIKNNPDLVFAAHQTVLVPGPGFKEKIDMEGEPIHQLAAFMCVSGAGLTCPPCLIHKPHTPPPEKEDALPDFWMVESTENGLMDRGLFTRWFYDIFLTNCSYDRPILLLVNVPSSHISLEVMDALKENEIELMFIPNEVMSLVHPLETLFLGIRERVHQLCQNTLNFWDIPEIVRLIIEEVCTDEAVVGSFAFGGLVPLNASVVMQRLTPDMKVVPKQRQRGGCSEDGGVLTKHKTVAVGKATKMKLGVKGKTNKGKAIKKVTAKKKPVTKKRKGAKS